MYMDNYLLTEARRQFSKEKSLFNNAGKVGYPYANKHGYIISYHVQKLTQNES